VLTAGLAVQIVAFQAARAWASTQAHGGDKLGDTDPAAITISASAGHTRA
jgi:hypothetical protein